MAHTILVAVKDLLFGSKIQEATKRTATVVTWSPRFEKLRDVAAARRPEVIIADLGEPGMLEELAAVKALLPDVKVLGFLGHTQEAAAGEAERIGVSEVYTKGQFSAQLDKILVAARG
jgi:DNA-binding NarL/FixJ family response regulator